MKFKIVTQYDLNPTMKQVGWRASVYKCEASAEFDDVNIESLEMTFINCKSQKDAILCATTWLKEHKENIKKSDLNRYDYATEGFAPIEGDIMAQQIREAQE